MPPRSFPLGNPFKGGKAGQAAGPPMFDVGAVNQMLAPYGVQLPSSFSDAGPFQQAAEDQQQGEGSILGKLMGGHPAIGRGLDNALIAAALTQPSRTAGEGISNVAQALLGVAPYRRQLAAQQAEIPLQFASTIGGLQAQQAMLKMYQGLGDYYRESGQSKAADITARGNVALMRYQMEGSMHPRIGKDAQGNDVVQTYQIDPNDPNMGGNWVNNPSLSVADLRAQNHRTNPVSGLAYQMFEGMHGQQPDPQTDPQGSMKWWSDFHDQQMADKKQSAFNVGLGHAEAPPSKTTTYDKFFASVGQEGSKLAFPKFDETGFINDQTEKLRTTPGPFYGKYSEARAQAKIAAAAEKQREANFNTQLAVHVGELHMMSPEQQEEIANKYGSLTGWLMKEKGLAVGADPMARSFAPLPSPEGQRNMQSGMLPGPTPQPLNVQPQAPQGASPMPPPPAATQGLDPNVQALMEMLRTTPSH